MKSDNISKVYEINPDEVLRHATHDPHRRASALADIILGGQDGLVNVLGVVLGVAAASADMRIILAAGLAATFAESVSMGAVAYTSTVAESEYYESEREREYRHILHFPELEKDEIRTIYRAKGFHDSLLERIVETITANPDIWVAVMMAEEHNLTPVSRGSALRSALIVGIASLIGSLVPLLPFFILPIGAAIGASVLFAALVLFLVGVVKARLTIGRPLRSGIEMAVIGTVSALIGYLVGAIFKVPPLP